MDPTRPPTADPAPTVSQAPDPMPVSDPMPVAGAVVRPSPVAVPWLLQTLLHLLVAGLLALTVVHALADGSAHPAVTIIAAVVLAAIYAAGPLLPAVQRSPGAAAAWLGCLLAAWLVLLALTPDGIWLAFPLFFLLMHLLPWAAGISTVAATTIAAIAGFAWHQGTLNPGFVIGPVLGAAVAVATVWGYQTIQAESESRRALIGQLRATRAELATAERGAGALAERERLAREIHDTLAQGLSSIQLLLRAAARTLPESGEVPAAALDTARTQIEQARQAAQDNLAEARRFVRALTPPDLQGRPLPAALQRLCSTTAERTGLPITFRLEGLPVLLPTPIEVALLRIAQSAVANITRHADATRAGVTLTIMDTAVVLDVVDDGVGFDPGTVTGGASAEPPADAGADGGFGLDAMRSRAAELGGTLTVESAPGEGTAVAVTFELIDADPEEGQ